MSKCRYVGVNIDPSGRPCRFGKVPEIPVGELRVEELLSCGTYHVRAVRWEDGVVVAWWIYREAPTDAALFLKGREAIMGKWIGQILPALSGKVRGKLAADAEVAKRTPALYELLTTVEYDGKPRQTSTVLLFAEGQTWKGCLKDRESGHYAFFTADTLLGVLDVMDAALQSGTCDWRADNNGQWKRNGK